MSTLPTFASFCDATCSVLCFTCLHFIHRLALACKFARKKNGRTDDKPALVLKILLGAVRQCHAQLVESIVNKLETCHCLFRSSTSTSSPPQLTASQNPAQSQPQSQLPGRPPRPPRLPCCRLLGLLRRALLRLLCLVRLLLPLQQTSQHGALMRPPSALHLLPAGLLCHWARRRRLPKGDPRPHSCCCCFCWPAAAGAPQSTLRGSAQALPPLPAAGGCCRRHLQARCCYCGWPGNGPPLGTTQQIAAAAQGLPQQGVPRLLMRPPLASQLGEQMRGRWGLAARGKQLR